jgi:hypothetical protein
MKKKPMKKIHHIIARSSIVAVILITIAWIAVAQSVGLSQDYDVKGCWESEEEGRQLVMHFFEGDNFSMEIFKGTNVVFFGGKYKIENGTLNTLLGDSYWSEVEYGFKKEDTLVLYGNKVFTKCTRESLEKTAMFVNSS